MEESFEQKFSAGFEKIAARLSVSNLSRDQYLHYLKYEDNQSFISKGAEYSRAEGKRQVKKQIAKKMLSESFEITLIAKVTGLSIEQINKLVLEV